MAEVMGSDPGGEVPDPKEQLNVRVPRSLRDSVRLLAEAREVTQAELLIAFIEAGVAEGREEITSVIEEESKRAERVGALLVSLTDAVNPEQ
jgi:hypothetical protein